MENWFVVPCCRVTTNRNTCGCLQLMVALMRFIRSHTHTTNSGHTMLGIREHLHTIAIRTKLQEPCKKHPFGSVLAFLATNEHITVVSEIDNHAVLPQQHQFAAKLLAGNLRISGRWYGGRESPDDTKFVFVCLPKTTSDACLFRSGDLYKHNDPNSYEVRFYRLQAKIRCGCTDSTAVETLCSKCDPYNSVFGKCLR